MTFTVTLPPAGWLVLAVAGQWSVRVPGCHHSLSAAIVAAPELAAPVVAGEFLHSISRPCVTNSLLPSAWERAERSRWRRPKTEALGILLDSVTANAPLEQGRCWEAPSSKACPGAGRARLGLRAFLHLHD